MQQDATGCQTTIIYWGHCTMNNWKDSQQPEVRTPIETKQRIVKAQHQTALQPIYLSKIRTGDKQRESVFSLFVILTYASGGDELVFPLSLTPSLFQERALPSLLRPAKINTFITTLCFLILVAIVFHLSLSQVSSTILVELFISIFTAHPWQTEKIRCKEKLKMRPKESNERS